MPRNQPSKSTPARIHPTANISSQTTPIQPKTSFGQIVKEGLGFGVGSAIGHRLVAAVFGPSPSVISPSSVSPSPSPSPSSESNQQSNTKKQQGPTEYEACLAENPEDTVVCAHFLQKK
jgi:hypothetical protein